MGMRTYAAHSYGLYVTENDVERYAEANKIDPIEVLEEIGISFSDADGECISIINGTSFDIEENIRFFMLELEKSPSLFAQAYANNEEAMQELKNKFQKYLPDDFNYDDMFVEYVGTVFG